MLFNVSNYWLEKVISCYRKKSKDTWIKECQNVPLADAVFIATTAINSHKKKHSHQNLISKPVLKMFYEKIYPLTDEIKTIKSFSVLHSFIERNKIKGIGQLAVYDAAVRIGANLGIEPESVYLHAGTRTGLNNLTSPNKLRTKNISKNELSKAFKKVSCQEIEDILCIYKEGLTSNYACKKKLMQMKKHCLNTNLGQR